MAEASDIQPRIAEQFDFIFCPVQYLADLALERVDLFISTYNLAEMTRKCVNHIFDCVEQVLKPQFMYSLNMVFSDKTIHFDTGGLDGEGNETVLNLRPEWWPKRFVLIPSFVDGKYRVTGSVVLQHVDTPPDILLRKLRDAARGCGQDERLGYLYLAALWSRSEDFASDFFEELERFFSELKITSDQHYNFDRIGEVMTLRRVLNHGSNKKGEPTRRN